MTGGFFLSLIYAEFDTKRVFARKVEQLFDPLVLMNCTLTVSLLLYLYSCAKSSEAVLMCRSYPSAFLRHLEFINVGNGTKIGILV